MEIDKNDRPQKDARYIEIDSITKEPGWIRTQVRWNHAYHHAEQKHIQETIIEVSIDTDGVSEYQEKDTYQKSKSETDVSAAAACRSILGIPCINTGSNTYNSVDKQNYNTSYDKSE